MRLAPNPQREWIVIFLVGLGIIAFSVFSSTKLIDRVVSGSFVPETKSEPAGSKPLDDVIRAGVILKNRNSPTLEQLEGEG